MLPLVVSAIGWAVEDLAANPGIAAMALAGLAMLKVSLFGGICLAMGLLALLLPSM